MLSLTPASCLTTDDHKFSEATAVLFTWIDRGEVNRRTANHFYSMIQSANSHVRRLMGEKAQHEEEMERAKETFKSALMAILTQCKNAFFIQPGSDSRQPRQVGHAQVRLATRSLIVLIHELTPGSSSTGGGAKRGQKLAGTNCML